MFGKGLVLSVALLIGCSSGAAETASIVEQSDEPSELADAEVVQTPEVPVEPLPTAASTPTSAAQAAPTDVPTGVEQNPTATPVPEPAPTVASTVEPSLPADVPDACWTVDEFDDTADLWQVVLDGVMGGRSSGEARVVDGALILSGTLNTNGGGFVLMRRLIEPSALEGASRLRIIGETDGRSYEIIADDGLAGRARNVSHFAPIRFDLSEASATGNVAFAEFEARSNGRTVATDAFRPDLGRRLGVIVADGVDGDFALRIERIEACA